VIDEAGTWLRLVTVAVVVLAVTWAFLALLARRLPPGAAKDFATVLPACATTARRLRHDDRVPRSAKLAIVIALVWVVSPIDLSRSSCRSSAHSMTCSSSRWRSGTQHGGAP
jgi:hypothetical protein